MTKRQCLSKKKRFEVFKRDRFACQYCGRQAPDVVLQVDHIKPVSKGGKNEIINLVTSCVDCNAGKSDRELRDDAEIIKQRRQIDDLDERRRQLEMLLDWKEEVLDLNGYALGRIEAALEKMDAGSLTDHGRKMFSRRIRKYGAGEVLESIVIAIDRYGCDEAFERVDGVLETRRRESCDPLYAPVNHIFYRLKKILRGSLRYDWQAKKAIRSLLENGNDAEWIIHFASGRGTWWEFISSAE